MKTIRGNLAFTVALIAVMASAVPVLGSAEFVFYGNARYTPGPPDAVGSVVEAYGILTTVGGLDFPIALDTDNFEYTVYLFDLTVASSGNNPPAVRNVAHTGGQLYIYADAIAGGTAADYGSPGTFTDGELILSALVDEGFQASLFDFDGDDLYSGFGSGSCDFTGGTQIDALVAANSWLEDWGLYATIADPDSGPGVVVPAGFDRLFDLKITPPNDPTPRASSSWGKLKSLYRRSVN